MTLHQHLLDLGKEKELVDLVLASDQSNEDGVVGAEVKGDGMVDAFGVDESKIGVKNEAAHDAERL